MRGSQMWETWKLRSGGETAIMGKKLALIFSVLLLCGFSLFRAGVSFLEEKPRFLMAGSLAEQVRKAKELSLQFQNPLDTEQLRICFRGEELACDRQTDTWYLPVDMDSGSFEAGDFSDLEGQAGLLPLLDYTALDKQDVVAKGQKIPFLAWQE